MARLRIALLTGERHAQQHVLERRKPGEQIERLKHEADVPGAEAVAADFGDAGDVGAVERDPAGVDGREPGDRVEERRLAAAAAAANHDLLAGRHGQPRNVENRQLAAIRLAVRFLDVFDEQHGSGSGGRAAVGRAGETPISGRACPARISRKAFQFNALRHGDKAKRDPRPHSVPYASTARRCSPPNAVMYTLAGKELQGELH